MVYTIYTEKKPGFRAEAEEILEDIRTVLGINVTELRVINRYDTDGISEEDFRAACSAVFSEAAQDVVFQDFGEAARGFAVIAAEFLPGQFDQRADSAAECISMLCGVTKPKVLYMKIYLVGGEISESDLKEIEKYLINPVEARLANPRVKYSRLDTAYDKPAEIAVLNGFTEADEAGLSAVLSDYSLAMDGADIAFLQKYFRDEEKRDPTLTEIRVIDTYWSDHCRHTTFGTIIDDADIAPDYIKLSYRKFLSGRKKLRREEKPLCLMEIATAGMRELSAAGKIPDLVESDEINACTIKIDNDMLLLFKNETHNHPTEIEPFGGAATCLGGAIRDPLSGRAYVYQALRVSGASDPRLPFSETLPGKLPPRKITSTAAAGFSSYGNQIGLATGQVAEIYDPGYMAKRMEIGAVVGAVPAAHVRRETPSPGDLIILLGGKTGRDGCGGATGSSKAHTNDSIETCGAEVQKGNAPEERKIQRLFRDKDVTLMIKRCNDFGAGGVSVAVGEIADGLEINLDKLPKKYEGLDGTELAISESQERMAVCVEAKNAEAFIAACAKENLNAVVIAEVTGESAGNVTGEAVGKSFLKMTWNGKTIVSISRDFLNSNGAEKHARAVIPAANVAEEDVMVSGVPITDLNVCSQKGLIERFDSTVGRGTVIFPFGGIYRATPEDFSAMMIPQLSETKTKNCSVIAYGFAAELSKRSPYHGAAWSVVSSVSKIVAAGADFTKTRLTFQEYFPRLGTDPLKWGLPLGAILGAYEAQTELEVPAIGGKDSMSGSFPGIDVPPTLVSFAVAAESAAHIISSEMKAGGNKILLAKLPVTGDLLPDYAGIKSLYAAVSAEIRRGNVVSARTVSAGGVSEAVFKMSIGNRIGADYRDCPAPYGSFVLEAAEIFPGAMDIGVTCDNFAINGEDGPELLKKYEAVLENVFKTTVPVSETENIADFSEKTEKPVIRFPGIRTARPKVLIPAFPGTNGEYDMAEAFREADADTEIFVVRNLSADAIKESAELFAKKARAAEIIAFPGGFSAGDEPEGSGKFITAFLHNGEVKSAVTELLDRRAGLILGICNGFQALIKSGLLPYGRLTEPDKDSPTLTFNKIARHQSAIVFTKVQSAASPWLTSCRPGEIYAVPVSHGEGRLIGEEPTLRALAESGQIAAQYVNLAGEASMETAWNPAGSMFAAECLISPDGRIIGKMGHSERVGKFFAKNVPEIYRGLEYRKNMEIFRSGVEYFR
ncbi:phosphoribosylformylglycinamidine synthase [Clostridia bacterium]|nr:phosphoribosylformylglycinamidine synthase [Clostridia bacterium]